MKKLLDRRLFEIGGIVASAILVALGITVLVMGFTGRGDVRDTITREQITGSPDMAPEAIRKEVAKSGLRISDLPSCTVANREIKTGSDARCFANYMRIHALLATGGQSFAQMGRYLDKDGKPTNDEQLAAKDPETGRPVENTQRNIWINERALATGLEMSYFAERVSLFSVGIGIALLLAGIGFGVLTLGGALRGRMDAGPPSAS